MAKFVVKAPTGIKWDPGISTLPGSEQRNVIKQLYKLHMGVILKIWKYEYLDCFFLSFFQEALKTK